MFVLWLLASVLGAALLAALPKDAFGKGLGITLGLLIPWTALVGWPWLFARRRGRGPAAEFGWRIRWIDLPLGLAGGLAAMLLASAVAWVTKSIFGSFNSTAGDVANEIHKDRFWLVVFALLVAFGAPVVEELAFRGVLFAGLLKRGLQPWLTNVFVALAFACFHFEPVRIPLLFVIGLVLGYLRQRTGRVGASAVAHSLNNAVGAWSFFG